MAAMSQLKTPLKSRSQFMVTVMLLNFLKLYKARCVVQHISHGLNCINFAHDKREQIRKEEEKEKEK